MMAHKELQHHLSAAIKKAPLQTEPVNIPNLLLGTNTIDLTVQAVNKPKALFGLLMVVFTQAISVAKSPRRKQGAAEKKVQNQLQQAHEETQSLREKLRSTDEELTTSKEELQSTNEKLRTVNTELVNKVDDLSWANNDMKKLLDSTEIATGFLDNNQQNIL
jgi:chromosome segregation ATPase